jgi:hypothetical protein
MRVTAIIPAAILAALVACGPAAAQSWKEYVYPGFTVSFPADPAIETTTYTTADGRSAEAHVYSASTDGGVFKMTVVDLADTGLEESAVIDHAIKALTEGGEVKVNIPHRINRIFGRQLSITGADGSHSTAAVFYYNGRLYQIEGTALPGGSAGAADTIRFQQSLIFTGGGSNRSEDAQREAFRANRRACREAADAAANAGAAVAEGTRADDPRCRRRGERRQNQNQNENQNQNLN